MLSLKDPAGRVDTDARDRHSYRMEALTMTPWKRIVTLAGVGCLIAGAALAQQQVRPPNAKSTPQPPNTPQQAPSHWGPPLEQPKDPIQDTAPQKPPKPPKPPRPPKPPKPPAEARKKPREESARLKGDADAETGSMRSSADTDDRAKPPSSGR
jgi:putative endonuclease